MAERRYFVMLRVDDDRGEGMRVKRALDEEGRRHDFEIDLHDFVDGAALLEYLDHCRNKEGPDCLRPDLIVLNLNLPAMGGRETLQKVISHPTCRRLPVMVFGGSVDQAKVIECYHCGGSVFRQKPCDSKTIREMVGLAVTYRLCPSQFPGGSPFSCMGYG